MNIASSLPILPEQSLDTTTKCTIGIASRDQASCTQETSVGAEHANISSKLQGCGRATLNCINWCYTKGYCSCLVLEAFELLLLD